MFHVSRGELAVLPLNAVLIARCAFVLWGRGIKLPSQHAPEPAPTMTPTPAETYAVDVLVCGAGATGLTLAIDLARQSDPARSSR